MSYKFGQLRRSQIASYMTSLEYDFIDIETKSELSQGIVFKDKAISLSSHNVLQSIDDSGKMIKSYYLQMKIYKQDVGQVITIKLINTNKREDNEQILTTITIDSKAWVDDYSVFEFVIPPNQTYDQIQCILNRTSLDYDIENTDGSYGRHLDIDIIKLTEIYNVIDFLNPSIENKGKLKQIGVQGIPGLLMSIDGEGIRVGRSGIYEINNGISISYLGFVVDSDDNQPFLLDYQY